jgi:hypothetical protein
VTRQALQCASIHHGSAKFTETSLDDSTVENKTDVGAMFQSTRQVDTIHKPKHLPPRASFSLCEYWHSKGRTQGVRACLNGHPHQMSDKTSITVCLYPPGIIEIPERSLDDSTVENKMDVGAIFQLTGHGNTIHTNPNISLLGRVFLPVNIGSQKQELKECEHV